MLIEIVPGAIVETHVSVNGGRDYMRTSQINVEKMPKKR
jgi:hypothetical protein